MQSMHGIAVLGDPVRREIVEVLLDHPEDAGTLAQRFPISRPAVSRHLRVLREAGVLQLREGAAALVTLPETAASLETASMSAAARPARVSVSRRRVMGSSARCASTSSLLR